MARARKSTAEGGVAGDPAERIAALLAPTLNDLGFDLVQVRLMGGQRPTLQVMAEPLDRDAPMTVDDCAEISHAVSAVLDVADPIDGAYALEVSSPGIDRPLVRLDDFVRFAGHEARFELDPSHEGRKRLKGRLDGVTAEQEIVVTADGAEWLVPFARIRRAKLVLTEALLAAALKGNAHAHQAEE